MSLQDQLMMSKRRR